MTVTAQRPASDQFDAQACIIGAGAAGLACGKALSDRGIAFDWFEKGSMVGGLWRIDNDNGSVAAYRTLHLNSSRTRTQFSSFPMPADWPDYPSHRLIAQYFQRFAEENDLLRRITFRTEVTSVVPVPGPGPQGAHGWEVTTRTTGMRRYQHVLIANGHHATPKRVTFPGNFAGEVLHSHDYREPGVFTDRDVVVVGVGNSGMDIACDAARLARSVHLVTRHGVHVIPKYAFGRPIDQFSTPFTALLPFALERLGYSALLRMTQGRPQDRGMPKPDHRLLEAHPTVSAELLDRVGHGDIVMKPGIERLESDRIRFADGTEVPADMLVLATGYDVSLPFLDPTVFDARGNVMRLFQRVVPPERPGLFFIGFIQVVGSVIPLAELQALWIADLITGEAVLPPDEEMLAWVDRDQDAMGQRYLASQRHTMQVDFWRYQRALERVRRLRGEPGHGLAAQQLVSSATSGGGRAARSAIRNGSRAALAVLNLPLAYRLASLAAPGADRGRDPAALAQDVREAQGVAADQGVGQ